MNGDTRVKRTVTLTLLVVGFTVMVCGAAFAITRDCDGGLCTGTNRADTLRGSEGVDKLLGEPGNDRLYGRGGDDMIKGGGGSDKIYGELGNDRVKGSQGADFVSGGEGDDLVRAGLHDRVNDGVRDVLDCGPGTDTVYFVNGQDKVMDNCEIRNP
jgi:Ca2+-binding RTX toxin-like protein